MSKTKAAKPAGPEVVHEPAIYTQHQIRELPGRLRKHVTVQPGETGLIIERGQVRQELPPGTHPVGWQLFGFGSDRAVGRVSVGPFSLPLRFFRLGDDSKEPLDAFGQATVSVVDVHRFYQSAVAGRQRLTATQLGHAVAASVQVILDQLVTGFSPGDLQRDPAAQVKLTNQIAPSLGDQLRDRGLHAVKVDQLVFRTSREGEALLDEALSLQSELASAGEKGQAELQKKVEQFSRRALAIELGSASETEALQAAAAAPSAEPTDVLTDSMQRWVARLTGQASERAQRLPGKAAPGPAGSPYRVSLTWLNSLLGWVVLAAVLVAVFVAGPVYILFKDKLGFDPRVYFPGAYGSLFLVISAATFARWAVSQWERWRAKHLAREAAGPEWFERWLTRDAARVDETIRQQIATELEQAPLASLEDSLRLSLSRNHAQEAKEIERLEGKVRYLAQTIRGAGYAGRTLATDGKQALQQGTRLVAFEEESLRLARIIVERAKAVKTQAQGGQPAVGQLRELDEALDALSQHFASRAGVVAGIQPPVSAQAH